MGSLLIKLLFFDGHCIGITDVFQELVGDDETNHHRERDITLHFGITMMNDRCLCRSPGTLFWFVHTESKKGLCRLAPGDVFLSFNKAFMALNFSLEYTFFDGPMAEYRWHIIRICWISARLSYKKNVLKTNLK